MALLNSATLRAIANVVESVDIMQDADTSDRVGIDQWRLVADDDTILGSINLNEDGTAHFVPEYNRKFNVHFGNDNYPVQINSSDAWRDVLR